MAVWLQAVSTEGWHSPGLVPQQPALQLLLLVAREGLPLMDAAERNSKITVEEWAN